MICIQFAGALKEVFSTPLGTIFFSLYFIFLLEFFEVNESSFSYAL